MSNNSDMSNLHLLLLSTGYRIFPIISRPFYIEKSFEKVGVDLYLRFDLNRRKDDDEDEDSYETDDAR